MTVQEAYVQGFCKTASAYGVDPEALMKLATESRDHGEGALFGAKLGLGVGGGLGLGTGALVGNEMLKDEIKNLGKPIERGVFDDAAAIARKKAFRDEMKKTVAKMNKSKLFKALTKAKWMAGPALALGASGAASTALPGTILGALIGKKKD